MFSGGRGDSREEDESKREETGNSLAWERDPPKKVVDASIFRPELSLRPYPLYIHILLTTPASNRVAASDDGPERNCRRSRTWVSPRCTAILRPGREVDMHERHMLPMVRRKLYASADHCCGPGDVAICFGWRAQTLAIPARLWQPAWSLKKSLVALGSRTLIFIQCNPTGP